MANTEPVEIIGFDFGDAETALTSILSSNRKAVPTKIKCNLAHPATGIIQTVIGYTPEGRIEIGGRAAANADTMKELYVGFKTVPREADRHYARLAKDFTNVLFSFLRDEGLALKRKSTIVVGHPSKWSKMPGEPVKLYEALLSSTAIGNLASIHVVPESRAAMIEALHSTDFGQKGSSSQPKEARKAAFEKGWVLLIDVGSSTSDFTAVNLESRKVQPIDTGEELGARLIDRAIVAHAISRHDDADKLQSWFSQHPAKKAAFELFCREQKEKYYTGQVVSVAMKTLIDGQLVYIGVDLDHTTMSDLTEGVPLIEFDGVAMNWRAAFKHVLSNTKAAFSANGVNKVTALLLTGGASQMPMVRQVCEEVFPGIKKDIYRAQDPSFAISNGLARWGNLTETNRVFFKRVEEFCDNEIKKTIEDGTDAFYEQISVQIADATVSVLKEEFFRWKRGYHDTINDMKDSVRSALDRWLDAELPQQIRKDTEAWLRHVSATLAQDIKGLENDSGLTIGTLGGAFSFPASGFDGLHSGVNVGSIQVLDQSMNEFVKAIGTVCGIIAAVVTKVVFPIVALLVLKIIGFVIAALTGIIVPFLFATPAGWAVLAAMGIIMFTSGASAKAIAEQKVQGIRLPGFIRDMVSEEKIVSKIESSRANIKSEIVRTLKSNKDVKRQITDDATQLYFGRLHEAANEALLSLA